MADIFYWSGIAGAALMFAGQFYSLRKRARFPRAIKVKKFLEAHVIAGILGPALVIVHSRLKFYGIAGIALGLMMIVTVSGFVGRYIYVRIPRDEKRMKALFAKWKSLHIPLTMLFFATVLLHLFAVYSY